jgi:uncharacterized protein (DUF1499 family)
MATGPSRMNPYWLAPAVAIGVPLLLGPLLAWLRVLRPDTAFFLVGMGVFLALVASAGLAAAAAYATATGRPWRRSALRAALLPGAVALGAIAFLECSDFPELNDVSTDLAERPVFSGDPPLSEDLAEIAAARLGSFAREQREAYPDLEPLLLSVPVDLAFARALEAAGRMPGWQVVRSDARSGEIEASATTRVFGFVDDVAIRVRRDPAGARIDVRSRSRLGRVDFGANAARIRAFMRELTPDANAAGPGDPAPQRAQ